MRHSRTGAWVVPFRVPDVKPGLYTTFFDCRPCGGTFFASTHSSAAWSPKHGSRVLKILRARPRHG